MTEKNKGDLCIFFAFEKVLVKMVFFKIKWWDVNTIALKNGIIPSLNTPCECVSYDSFKELVEII